jgi:hypothetical protein
MEFIMTRLQYFSVLVGVISAIMARPSHTKAQRVIDYNTTVTQSGEDIRVIRGNNPNPPTIVNVEITDGSARTRIGAFDNSIVNVLDGVFDEEDIVAHDTATINFRGGSVDDVMLTLDSATTNIYGGHFQDVVLKALDFGTINVYAGDLEDSGDVFADNSATVNLYGGFDDGIGSCDFDVRGMGSSSLNFFDGCFEDVSVYGSSKSEIYGGVFEEDFEAYDSSKIDVWGGGPSIEANDTSTIRVFDGSPRVGAANASSVHIFGGHIRGVLHAGFPRPGTPSSAVITVYGIDFNYPYGPIPDAEGTLTGTLSNGDTINSEFSIRNGASIVLQVPEPSSAVLLVMAVPWCFSTAMRARRLPPRWKR